MLVVGVEIRGVDDLAVKSEGWRDQTSEGHPRQTIRLTRTYLAQPVAHHRSNTSQTISTSHVQQVPHRTRCTPVHQEICREMR